MTNYWLKLRRRRKHDKKQAEIDRAVVAALNKARSPKIRKKYKRPVRIP